MNDELNIRRTEMSFSFLMHQLFGQRSYGELKDYHRTTEAKKYYLKLIKSFNHAICETIEIADKNQIKNLSNILQNGERQIKLCKTFAAIDQTFIAMETKFILQLLGQIPNRSREKTVLNRKENWKLNGLRQIQYVQNSKNKELLIFKLVQDRFMDRFGDWSDFVSLYSEKCNNNINELLDYLRLNQPEIYAEIE